MTGIARRADPPAVRAGQMLSAHPEERTLSDPYQARPGSGARPPRRSVFAPLVLLVALTGCSGVATDGGDPTVGASQSAASVPGEAEKPTPAPPPAEPVQVGVTATGVPVEVLERTPAAFSVMTPCGRTRELDNVTPVYDIRVVIDPGHGGPVDTGTEGPNGVLESHLNLRLAVAVQERLTAMDVSAMLTRTGDYAMPLAVRASLADATDATVLVSLHHNSPASAPSSEPGSEVYVQSDSEESARLGTLLYDRVTAALSSFDVAWTSRDDAGVLAVTLPDGGDAYGMIRRPATPTALVELGYLANPAEAELFATDAYLDVASGAVAAAVVDHLADESAPGSITGGRTFTPAHSSGAEDCADPALE